MARGASESPWLVVRRCLAILRRLQQSPADWHTLIEAVLLAEGHDAYGQAEGTALKKRFHRDLEHLRHSLHITIELDRRTGEYSITGLERPLLNLPDADLEIIAWLEQTFSAATPHATEVRDLLARLQFYLDSDRRHYVAQHRTALVLDLGQRDEDYLRPDVELKLRQALIERRRVEFDYLSPKYADEQCRRHVVDIFEPYYFDPVGGHYYVYGWCRYSVGPQGHKTVDAYRHFRLGRIQAVRLLPHKLPPSPPDVKQIPIVYHLSAKVARYGVTQRRWIAINHIDPQPDGSAIIHGKTTNTFWSIQELMHYGAQCEVLGGPEMRRAMRDIVRDMAARYADDPQ